jgi:hypothetical protein
LQQIFRFYGSSPRRRRKPDTFPPLWISIDPAGGLRLSLFFLASTNTFNSSASASTSYPTDTGSNGGFESFAAAAD